LFLGKTICYKNVGCFSNLPPYRNTHGTLPLSPDSINTTFSLHTRQNPTHAQHLDPYNPESLNASHFDGLRKTVFIVHGYHTTENKDWIIHMTAALLAEVFCSQYD
jgi:hypothetical protein